MNRRRLLSFALAMLAATSLAVGSIGFSSVTAQRSVEVAVVDSDEAYVGVRACEKRSESGTSGSNPVHVWVTNRFTDQFTVDLIESAGQTKTPNSGATLAPGEEERFEANFAESSVTVHVSGDGLDATVTVDITTKADCGVTTTTTSATTTTTTTTTSTTTTATTTTTTTST